MEVLRALHEPHSRRRWSTPHRDPGRRQGGRSQERRHRL